MSSSPSYEPVGSHEAATRKKGKSIETMAELEGRRHRVTLIARGFLRQLQKAASGKQAWVLACALIYYVQP
jgi:hypothetical protein